MSGNSTSNNSTPSGPGNDKQNWDASPSTVFNHFCYKWTFRGGCNCNYSPFRCIESKATNATCWPERSFGWNGLRLGLYEPSKYACDLAFGSSNDLVKIALGMFAGAISTVLTNPMEVLKVRLQMNSDMRKSGPITELQRTVSEEGIRALWKGVGPALARAAALTASQLATYDETKQILVRWTSLKEGFPLHLISSTAAGILSTLVTAPIDMVKTRLMLQREAKEIRIYNGGFHCAYQVLLRRVQGDFTKGALQYLQDQGHKPQLHLYYVRS